MYLSVGSIIIDDIVLPDGRTMMGALGGGATHAVMGMRAWADQVAISAAVGADFPPDLLDQLQVYMDTRGVVVRPHLSTPRAWQLFEPDGHRSELFRTSFEDFRAINTHPAEVPDETLRARGVHLQAEAPHPLIEWVQELRSRGCEFILWEPWESYCQTANFATMRQIFPLVDGFSPNLEEAHQITGLLDPYEISETLIQAGARLVVIRMGAQGSLLLDQYGQEITVPIIPVPRVVDETGAGNAYCGGLVVGMVETGDLGEAARRAAVSASLALEQFGALYPLDHLRERAQERLEYATIVYGRSKAWKNSG